MKRNIIQRLYDSKHITFDEMMILLDVQSPSDIFYPPYYPPYQPPYYYTTAPFVVTCNNKVNTTDFDLSCSTTPIDQNAYSDSFKTYDPKEYKESK